MELWWASDPLYKHFCLTLFHEDLSLHGLHLNLSKCKLFWPSGDSFPEFPSDIKWVDGLEVLGSAFWGDKCFLLRVFMLSYR